MGSAETLPVSIDDLFLIDVNRFDIWDRRESAVANAHAWKAACEEYKSSSEFKSGIPLKMHQIWIGSRQPPCVWLDTWRIDFMNKFATCEASENHWQYILWDNEKVRDMPMLNRYIFDNESAPQCQADILRLEVLYQYGGVYVDADIVSTQRDLRPALEAAKETGFLITYEPDTKDKPYSILGNSLIACTPRHPLILMLISYIKQIYGYKRAHYGVEWVTGPLTYTKVLTHTDMPVTIPPSKDFYPAFHYVPNPSAIDVTSFDSYCFQFG
ncbi:Glycosyltransferase [Gracilaria domingensis]|nr:Glycosyltransferase [Gracilaria domingensis]